MSNRTRFNPALTLAVPAILLAGALASATLPAKLHSADAQFAANREVLSWAIAGQGNLALQSIRADARDAIRHWPLPALPAPAADELADAAP